MKAFITKLFAVMLAVLMIMSVATIYVGAAPEKTVTTAADTETTDQQVADAEVATKVADPGTAAFNASLDKRKNYTDYLSTHASAAHPNLSILLDPNKAVMFDANTGAALDKKLPIISISPVFKDDTRSGVLLPDDGIAGWTFDVPTTGMYNITFTYFAYDTVTYTQDGQQVTLNSKSSAVSRKLYIDGALPFFEARQINLERTWKDEQPIKTDAVTQNEKRPFQVEAPEWQTVTLHDYMGYFNEPYSFYFEQGTHTIALEAVREGMIVQSVELHQSAGQPSYSELSAQYAQKGYKAVSSDTQNLVIQAEGEHDTYKDYIAAGEVGYDASKDPTYKILKSAPTMYPITDRSSPLTQPYHFSKIRLNTIGGAKWENPNEWIEWSITVPEAGLYTISLKSRQNVLGGMFTSRCLLINGVVPCAEVNNIKFPYSADFIMTTIGDANGAYQFYLNKGSNTIRLENTLGDLAPILSRAEDVVYELNTAYRRILMLTGPTPDLNRDYVFDKMVPDALATIVKQNEEMKSIENDIKTSVGSGGSEQTAVLKKMILITDGIIQDSTTIAARFSDFKDTIAALGTWINDMRQQPLELDYIVVSAPNATLPRAKATFMEKVIHEVRSFIASFTEDYDNIGGANVNAKDTVVVWIETGAGLAGNRDNATILKQITDDMFTAKTGIPVSVRLVASGSLLPATLAGKGPDICITRSSTDAINYAFRGAVQNLADEDLFPDYKQVFSQFYQSALDPFSFRSGTYAIPETQDFPMLFYRTDILDELGLKVPQTWDDVYSLIGELQNKQMEFGMPVPVSGTVGAGIGSFATLLFQKGGAFYEPDGVASGLTSDAALNAFRQWTQFYTQYKLPNAYDFANRFRSGEMPVAIANYSAYNTLAVFAPEIQGLWQFGLIPGTAQVDSAGNPVIGADGKQVIDRSCAGGVSGSVMLSTAKNKQNSWQFLRWWTGKDAQATFGREIESMLGAAARYSTANIAAMQELPWTKDASDAITAQWQYVKGIPEVPGSYYTGRNVEFAWKEVINNGTNPNTVLLEYVRDINIEIARKRDEFKDKLAQMK